MDEAALRDLAGDLRATLMVVVHDDRVREDLAAELDEALAVPEGSAKGLLLAVIARRPETRDWAAARLSDQERVLSGLPGLTMGSALHFVCPKGDRDRFLENAAEDPGRCPVHGLRFVQASD